MNTYNLSQYKILTDMWPMGLEKKVAELLYQGWVVVGGLGSYQDDQGRSHLVQAMGYPYRNYSAKGIQ